MKDFDWNRITCFFIKHDWIYFIDYSYPKTTRHCRRCGKDEERV